MLIRYRHHMKVSYLGLVQTGLDHKRFTHLSYLLNELNKNQQSNPYNLFDPYII